MKKHIAAALAIMAVVAPASAGLPFAGLLGKVSDSALDKLSQPGAFYADEAVRIALPGPLKNASGLMKLADGAGLTNGLSKSINDAAGIAAGQAKPIFRAAIDRMTITDAARIVAKADGGTQYLRSSAGDVLRGKMRPLVLGALGKTGAFTQLDRIGKTGGLLARVGISRDGLTDSVTDQAMDGIFSYMGAEERKARANPLNTGQSLLRQLRGN